MKLLLVEDEDDLAFVLARGLRRQGYAVDRAADGEEALYYYALGGYDLLILDLNLPKLDGLTVLRRIRQADTHTRILILSARTRIDERVEGLDAGANDYLVKPFDFEELHARVRALCRTEFESRPAVLHLGALALDTAAKTVTLQGEPVGLTKKEYAVLEYLMQHRGAVVSAEELLDHVWDSEADPFSSTVKYHIHTIKKKLGGGLIQNVRGQGYRLTEETDEADL